MLERPGENRFQARAGNHRSPRVKPNITKIRRQHSTESISLEDINTAIAQPDL
ncbi:hypothetical protein CY34DRAFT_803175 [Suillus luteus UH-Slu-Lm8-n1]|uniref:Uncharacterized protein n=1 Tax=Suillus luteus UH-Slu-Lm8-n1 TaxID=930992 RepID=A0A0D0A289_9AGAM|nr:hypothetical protein CY34DRAFT_803175 [Suillus luteus UH-Slu-Lm8-n1]